LTDSLLCFYRNSEKRKEQRRRPIK